jgi:hypothetical protein
MSSEARQHRLRPDHEPLPQRLFYATGENTRHVRHAQLLARWEVLEEEWALEVEAARLAAVDRTPGAATFGR